MYAKLNTMVFFVIDTMAAIDLTLFIRLLWQHIKWSINMYNTTLPEM